MGGGELMHLVNLAVGGATAIEWHSIPRGHSLLEYSPGIAGCLPMEGARPKKAKGPLRQKRKAVEPEVRLYRSDARNPPQTSLQALKAAVKRERKVWRLIQLRFSPPLKAAVPQNRSSRGDLVHLFARKFGIIGMHPYSRKESH